jgi:hypothetical protein
MSLGAATLVDSRKTLIVCPQYARLGWADEVQEWLGEGALLLCGRGGREARERCLTCKGRGTLVDGAQCMDCRGRNGQSTGYRIYDVPELSSFNVVDRTQGAIQWSNLGKLACTRHPDVTMQASPDLTQRPMCGKCYRELYTAIDRARYVIVNYELLVQHHTDVGGGVVVARSDLAGWVDTLKQFTWDVCIADEGQMLRGWSTATRRAGVPRNEKMLELVGSNTIPRVWIVTGTPFYGFVRDIFWLLEIASGGLWGSDTRLRGKKFMIRYCEGKQTNYGFQAKGRSAYAEVELMRRLVGAPREQGAIQSDGIMIQRTREELFKDVPPMGRQVVHLDIEGVRPWIPGHTKRGGATIAKMIVALNDLKREAVIDKFINELSEGNKIVVFCFHVPSAKKTFLALEKALASPAVRTRMRQVNAKVWLATGPRRKKKGEGEDDEADNDSTTLEDVQLTDEQRKNWATDGDARYRMAEQYREHVGAAALVATTESMPGALSLKGASSVHFLDLHWSPGAMAQAENRPWHPEVKDLTVVYYVVRGSVDDHIEAEVLPKAETLARMGREKGAEAMLAAFNRTEEDRTLDAIYARLTRHVRLDAESGVEG